MNYKKYRPSKLYYTNKYYNEVLNIVDQNLKDGFLTELVLDLTTWSNKSGFPIVFAAFHRIILEIDSGTYKVLKDRNGC